MQLSKRTVSLDTQCVRTLQHECKRSYKNDKIVSYMILLATPHVREKKTVCYPPPALQSKICYALRILQHLHYMHLH